MNAESARRWARPPARRSPGPAARTAALWLSVVALTLALQWRWLVLYLDLRYTFGALRTGAQGGWPATDVFIHRPMANRLLMAGLDQLTFGPTVFRERLTLSLGIVAAGLAGAALARALRGWTSTPVATGVGLAVFAALAWAPAVTVLQPEWTATLLSVGAVAMALARGPDGLASWRSPLIAGAGLLLAIATLQKYTTATTVVVALGLILVLHRRVGWLVAGWAVALSVLLLGLTLLNAHERQWFADMPRLNQTGTFDVHAFGRSLWNLAWLNPILLVWPAAIILGFRLSQRRRWWLGSAGALVVVLAGVIVQNGYFPYHYAVLPVLAAGPVSLACGQWWQQTRRLSGIVAVGLVWVPIAAWLARRPSLWRAEHQEWAALSVGLVIVLSITLVLWQTRKSAGPARARRPHATSSRLILALTLLTLAMLISFPAWPHTPYAIYSARANRTSEVAMRARAMGVGAQLRAAAHGAQVVYLARLDAAYSIGLPTGCVYPTATFLYRSARMTEATRVRSVQENLACLRDPSAAFLVLQPAMIDPEHAVPLVRDTVAAQFDCEHPVARAGSFRLCPRR